VQERERKIEGDRGRGREGPRQRKQKREIERDSWGERDGGNREERVQRGRLKMDWECNSAQQGSFDHATAAASPL
jgi:hypothetical protein